MQMDCIIPCFQLTQVSVEESDAETDPGQSVLDQEDHDQEAEHDPWTPSAQHQTQHQHQPPPKVTASPGINEHTI